MTRRPWLLSVAGVLACAAGVEGQVDVGGWVDYQAIVYAQSRPVGRLGRNQVRVQPEGTLDLGSWGRVFAAVELRGDGVASRRNRAWTDEAFVDLYVGPVDVRVGRQILAWGRADALNPTDYLGSRDYTDVLDADQERLAQDALKLTWFASRGSVEVVFAPRARPSLVPIPDSRWWPPRQDASSAVPAPSVRLTDDPARPGRSAALGVRASASVRSVDLALSLYRGPWHLSALVAHPPTPDPEGTVVVEVTTVSPRLSAVGFDLATVVGQVGLHAEAATYLFDDREASAPGLDGPFLRYVVGWDYAVRRVMGDRTLRLFAEWTHEVPLRSDADPWSPNDLNHVFRRAILARAESPVTDESTIRVEGAYDAARGGWATSMEGEWRARQGMLVRVSADILGGGPDTFFGTFRSNRRIHAVLRFAF